MPLLGAFTSAQAVPPLQLAQVGGAPVVLRLNEGRIQVRARLSPDAAGSDELTTQIRGGLDVSLALGADWVRLDFRASSGDRFEGGWMSDIGDGSEDPFTVRRVSLSVRPTQGVEITVGGLEPLDGAASSFTSLPNSFIAGYRVRVEQEGMDLVLTGGFQRQDPSFAQFERLLTFQDWDYLQVALTQTIARILTSSLEYQRFGDLHTVRSALRLQLGQWLPFLNALTTEGALAIQANGRIAGGVWVSSLSALFRRLLAGQDLRAALIFGYNGLNEEDLRFASQLFSGWAGRISVMLPNLVSLGPWAHLEVGAVGNISFEDPRIWRLDFVMGITM